MSDNISSIFSEVFCPCSTQKYVSADSVLHFSAGISKDAHGTNDFSLKIISAKSLLSLLILSSAFSILSHISILWEITFSSVSSLYVIKGRFLKRFFSAENFFKTVIPFSILLISSSSFEMSDISHSSKTCFISSGTTDCAWIGCMTPHFKISSTTSSV